MIKWNAENAVNSASRRLKNFDVVRATQEARHGLS